MVIIVAARDAYQETWEPFFGLFFKYWPDCPYPVYLFTERATFVHSRVLSLAIEDDPAESWAEQWEGRFRKALHKTGAKQFMFLHTDYFLCRPVDTKRIQELVTLLERKDIGHIRLVAAPTPTLDFSEDAKLGTIAKTEKYRVSLQAGLWKRKVFEQLLLPGFGPIDLEDRGSINSARLPETFLSSKKGYSALAYVHGIGKGRWFYDAVRFLAREGYHAPAGKALETFGAYLSRILSIDRLKYKLKILLRKI